MIADDGMACYNPGDLNAGPTDAESISPREESPSELGINAAISGKLKQTTWELANEFADTFELLRGMYKASVPHGVITLPVVVAISRRAKSMSDETIIRVLDGLV